MLKHLTGTWKLEECKVVGSGRVIKYSHNIFTFTAIKSTLDKNVLEHEEWDVGAAVPLTWLSWYCGNTTPQVIGTTCGMPLRQSRAEERGIKKGFFFCFFQTYATVMRPFYVFIF